MNNFDLRKYLAEGKLLKENHTKASVLKALGDADDAMIQLTDGSELIIYNPDSNNDDNAAMWHRDSVFAVNKDGDEKEVKYSDISGINLEETLNEGDMDHLMQDLEGELKRHDWFYYMADDSRSYGKGELQQQEIKRLLKMLNNSPEAIALYNKYAPVQGGIDLRIKEEKIEETVELPKDIKWEFDDIIDQMDTHNATISLIGHSESTGKDYTASAEASRGGEGGDWDWMEVDEVEEETVAEEKRPDYPDVDKDGDTEESMEKALKDKEATLKEWGSSDWHYFFNSMHRDLGNPTDAPDIMKVLDVAGENVDHYWDDWEEYETDRQGLYMHAAQRYLKAKFPEYYKGMKALFTPMNEQYTVGKGMEKDHDFDAMLDHALKLHAGTPIEDLKKVAHDFTDVNYHREVAYLEDAIDMLEAGKHEEFEDSLKLFKDEVEKTIRSFKESIEESLRAWNVIDIDGNVTHEGLSYEEALEIAKKVEGHKIRPTNMMLDEVEKTIRSFKESIKEGQGDDHHYIKVPTKEYKKAQAILNQNIDPTYVKMEVVDNDGAGNVIFYFIFKHEDGFDDMYDDSGDTDSEFYQEPEEDGGAFVYDAAMDLQANDITVVSHSADDLAEGDYDPDQEQLDDEDEIFMPMDDEGRPLEEALNPEVTKAVNRLIKGLAKKYDYSERDAVFAIQAALKQREYDSVNEDLDLGHQDNEPGMLKADLYKIGNYAMELYQMMDDLEDIDGEVDLPHWWQSKINTAKNMIDGAKHYLEFELKEPAIDAMVTEDSLDDEAKVYFMQKVKRGEIDKLPEDPKAAFLAQMTKDEIEHDKETLDREGGLEEDSFYTKDIKDAVISKLMDQLKK